MRKKSFNAKHRESGAALLMATGMMSVAVFFGLLYAVSATSSLQSSQTSLQRYRAQTLAEGGLDSAIYKLMQDPSYSGVSGPDKFIGGELTVTVTSSGAERSVVSIVEVGGISSGYIAELSAATRLVVSDTAYIQAGIFLDKSKLSWGGLASLVGMIDETNGSVADGRSQILGTIPAFSLDESILSSTASYVRIGDSALPSGSYEGRIYVDNGELTLGGGAVKSFGGVFCDGRLILDASGASVSILKDEAIDGGALYAKGDILIRNCSELVISGSVFAEGNLIFENVSNARINGSLLAGAQLILLNSAVELSYDESILKSLSEGVNGGRQSASIVEKLRRAFTGPTPPTLTGSQLTDAEEVVPEKKTKEVVKTK